MGIGTSLGAYFDDAFHHQAGINTDPSMDNNTIDPDLDSGAGVKPKPKLDIMPVSDTVTAENTAEHMAGEASSKAYEALRRSKTGEELPNIEDVPHHDAIEEIGKTLFNAVTLPGDVYQGKVDPSSDEALHRSLDLAGLTGFGTIKTGKPAFEPPSFEPHYPIGTTSNTPNFDSVVRAVRNGGRATEQNVLTGQALRRIHEALGEDSRLATSTPVRESFDELMARLDREDAAATKQRNASFDKLDKKEYKGVQVAESGKGYGSFLFKAGDSDVMSMSIHELEGGKLLKVGGIGDMNNWTKNTIGTRAVRGLLEALAEKYPDAERIAGFRVSGARSTSGKGAANAEMYLPGRKPKGEPRRKSIQELNDEWDLSSPTE